MNIKNKQEAKEIIDCLITSCEEGINGIWDSSEGNNKEGFDAMIIQLEGLREFIKLV